ncbi:hypothetical protein AVEN_82677-1 [Araneus ventricosus]|uniref:Uncharacterized protein n=1 Tax=Araneus ventricosus TaxID=182803 RepID=A0A4Y2PXD2_ARAVE|nr:hypothetical protein AVEN_82677-1 [Araneus ventricosus]
MSLQCKLSASSSHGDFEDCINLLQTCFTLALLSYQICYKLADLQCKSAANLLQTKIAIWVETIRKESLRSSRISSSMREPLLSPSRFYTGRISAFIAGSLNRFREKLDFQIFDGTMPILIGYSHWRPALAWCDRIGVECPA